MVYVQIEITLICDLDMHASYLVARACIPIVTGTLSYNDDGITHDLLKLFIHPVPRRRQDLYSGCHGLSSKGTTVPHCALATCCTSIAPLPYGPSIWPICRAQPVAPLYVQRTVPHWGRVRNVRAPQHNRVLRSPEAVQGTKW